MSTFSFSSLGHAFAYCAQKIVQGAKVIESVLAKVAATEPVVEQITSMIDPSAVILERAAYALLGMALHAVHDAGEAASAQGLNISLDVQTVQDLKALLPAVKAQVGTLTILKTP